MTAVQSFETPEDVGLDFRLAGTVARASAYLLDRMILLAAQLVFILFAVFAWEAWTSWDDLGPATVTLLVILWGFSEFLYFGWFEWRGNGRTPGKRMLGLRAIRDGGYRLEAGPAWLRNLLRPVDLLPPCWLVPLLDRRNRRLGDLAAGTLVVHDAPEAAPAAPLHDWRYADLAQRHLELGRIALQRLRREDYLAMEGFLARRVDLPRAARRRLGRTLAVAALRRMELPQPATGEAEDWLEEVYLAARDAPGLVEELGGEKI